MTNIRFITTILLGLLVAGTARGQTSATWRSGDGSWSDSTQWSTNPTIPNGVDFNVQIDAGNPIDSTVHTGSNQDFSVGSLTIDAGDSLRIDNGSTFSTLTDSNVNPSSGASSNAGTIAVGGTFNLGGNTFNNTGGTIDVLDNGSLFVGADNHIRGGTLRSSDSGSIELGLGSKIEDLTIDGVVNKDIQSRSNFLAEGTIDNRGTINTNTNRISLSGDTFLTGKGVVNLGIPGGVFPGAIFRDFTNGTTPLTQVKLTNVNNSIRGHGTIGLPTDSKIELVNESSGTIEASSTFFAELFIETRAGTEFVNRGTLRAKDVGTLTIKSDTVDNTGGLIEAIGEHASVIIDANAINGGTIRATDEAVIGLGAARISGVTNEGRMFVFGDSIFDGTINNRGTINIIVNGETVLVDEGSDVVLTGGGTTKIIDQTGAPSIGQTGVTSTLTNVDNTIRGSYLLGEGDLTFRNQAGGTVTGSDSSTPSFVRIFSRDPEETNRGTFHVTSNAFFSVAGDFVNNGLIQIDTGGLFGTLEGQFTNSAIGSIVGNGTVDPSQMFVNEGRIAPGQSVGELIITESTTFGQTAVLDVEIDADGADLLTVFGDLVLAGELRISLLDGFNPLNSDVYQIVQISDQDSEDGAINTLTGQFTGIDDGQTVSTTDGRGSFIVRYTDEGVFLSNFVAVVPEPAAATLFGTLALLSATLRRRRPNAQL